MSDYFCSFSKCCLCSTHFYFKRQFFTDQRNEWLLEQWLLYINEMRQLERREEELSLLMRQYEVTSDHRQKRKQLRDLQKSAQVDSTELVKMHICCFFDKAN